MATDTNEVIYCPRAQSDYTPCVARDGRLALADAGMCVGCGWEPRYLLGDLAQRYEPADQVDTRNPERAADKFRDLVKEYVEAKAK